MNIHLFGKLMIKTNKHIGLHPLAITSCKIGNKGLVIMKINVIGLDRLSLHKLNQLKSNYENYKHLPVTNQYYKQIVETIKRKEMNTINNRINDALASNYADHFIRIAANWYRATA